MCPQLILVLHAGGRVCVEISNTLRLCKLFALLSIYLLKMNPSLLCVSPHTLLSAFFIGLTIWNSDLVICTKMHIVTHIHVSSSYYYIYVSSYYCVLLVVQVWLSDEDAYMLCVCACCLREWQNTIDAYRWMSIGSTYISSKVVGFVLLNFWNVNICPLSAPCCWDWGESALRTVPAILQASLP